MKLSKKELAMLHSALRSMIDNEKSPTKVGVWVGSDDGSDDHTESVGASDWENLDDKMFSVISAAWVEESK